MNELLNDEVKPNLLSEIFKASERFHSSDECAKAAVRKVEEDIEIMKREAKKFLKRDDNEYLPLIEIQKSENARRNTTIPIDDGMIH